MKPKIPESIILQVRNLSSKICNRNALIRLKATRTTVVREVVVVVVVVVLQHAPQRYATSETIGYLSIADARRTLDRIDQLLYSICSSVVVACFGRVPRKIKCKFALNATELSWITSSRR